MPELWDSSKPARKHKDFVHSKRATLVVEHSRSDDSKLDFKDFEEFCFPLRQRHRDGGGAEARAAAGVLGRRSAQGARRWFGRSEGAKEFFIG